MATPTPHTSNKAVLPKIRVMLVDDSAVIRGFLTRMLESDDRIEVVCSVNNGEIAVNRVKQIKPDVIVLDIEMPVMDGLTALPLIQKEYPEAKILMCSTLSERGADISLKAMSLGAADCIVKPTSTGEINSSNDFKSGLLWRIKGLARGKSLIAAQTKSVLQKTKSQPATTADTSQTYELNTSPDVHMGAPNIIAIGSSTGGPHALFKVMGSFHNVRVPVIITQHMPKTFTALLAKHISQNCNIDCVEAEDGMILKAGRAYIAPGGYHMTFKQDSLVTRIVIDDSPPENFPEYGSVNTDL